MAPRKGTPMDWSSGTTQGGAAWPVQLTSTSFHHNCSPICAAAKARSGQPPPLKSATAPPCAPIQYSSSSCDGPDGCGRAVQRRCDDVGMAVAVEVADQDGVGKGPGTHSVLAARGERP